MRQLQRSTLYNAHHKIGGQDMTGCLLFSSSFSLICLPFFFLSNLQLIKGHGNITENETCPFSLFLTVKRRGGI